ncbi:hypothetical protein [Sphingomonas sp. M1A8_2b]
MAKTKTGTKSKTGKVKIPKQIGGMKVPKELRKKGEALIEKASTPQGREAITAGLAMAATVAVAAIERQRTKQTAAPAAEAKSETAAPTAAAPSAAEATASRAAAAEDGPQKPGMSGMQSPQAVADAIGQAAEMMLGRFFSKKV